MKKMPSHSQPSLILCRILISKHFPNSPPLSLIYSPPSYKRPVSISFTPEPTNLNKTWTLSPFQFSPSSHFPHSPSFSPPLAQKRKVQTETSSIITATRNDSTNHQLTSSSWKDELEELKKKVNLQWKR